MARAGRADARTWASRASSRSVTANLSSLTNRPASRFSSGGTDLSSSKRRVTWPLLRPRKAVRRSSRFAMGGPLGGRRLRHPHEVGERLRGVDGQVGQDLAVKADIARLQAADEAAIGRAVGQRPGLD